VQAEIAPGETLRGIEGGGSGYGDPRKYGYNIGIKR
jgi:hypothetical protein